MVRDFYSDRITTSKAAMAKLELNYLGDFEVLKSGKAGRLPPSKKTRALLAYLTMNPRKFRREYLCELLWEIPDDPRGSLRWSLSKLRRLIDDPKQPRILADRTYVEVDTRNVRIDALEVQKFASQGLAEASVEHLEAAAERFRGNFLEGLDLPNFHDFHAWCIAEREQIAHAQSAILNALVGRFEGEPERALPHLRALVGLSPYDEALRANMIRALVALARNDEADRQFELGLRMLKEVGVASTGALNAARQRQQPTSASTTERTAAAASMTRPAVEVSSGLIGRDSEATRLAGLYAEVERERKARFALIRGEPGIGKTRLVEAVSALALGAGATVLQASAYESESIRPFALWIDALHRYAEDESTRIFSETEGGSRDHLFDRLSNFVARQTTEKPFVLVFDDVHWCDDSSAAAIHYVARMNRNRPLFGILVSRVADLTDNTHAQQAIAGLRHDGLLNEISVGPMSEEDLLDLIRERAPDVDARKLSRQCGGNPLLAIELARAEREGDTSTSVSDLMRERLARFSIDGAEALRWAAVLNPHITLEAVAKLADLDEATASDVLESAIRQGMLTMAGDGIHFSHDLLTRAVYESLPVMRRQVMHRRIAEYLEKNTALDLGKAADLAHHATHSGDPAMAGRAMVSAGRMCLRFYANEEALIHVKRGMQFAQNLPEAERVPLLIDLSDVRLAAGPLDDWEQSALEFAALAEQALDLGELAHARLGYHLAATVRWAHGQWSTAHEQSLQSERVVRTGKDEDHIVGMAETAKCLAMIERDLSKADAMLMEAQAMSTRKGFSHYAIPAGLGMLRFHEGRMDEAVELFREALTLCKLAGSRIDEYQANEYLAMIEFQRGHYEEAGAIARNMEAIGEKLRVGSEGPFARAVTALCEFATSDDDTALIEALESLRVADAKYRLAYVLTRAAQLDCDRGRFDVAVRRAAEALDYATVLQRPTEMALARAVLGCTSAERGDDDKAAEHKTAIEELAALGVAAWAVEFFDQKAGRKKEARQ